MAAPVRTPREAWVKAGLSALSAGGPDAVRVEALAKALGVTKGGFYWHFTDRDALLEAMLDSWEQRLVDQAVAVADGSGGSARSRLRRLFGFAGDNPALMDLELAVRDWGRRSPSVAQRVRRVDDRRLGYLRPLFAEFCDGPADVEGRCLLVLTLFVGSPAVGASHPGRTRAQAETAAVRHLLR